MKTLKRTLTILFAVLFLAWLATRISLSISFDRDIGGYLKHIANANTVQLATENLDVAIKSIEDKKWTSGYTAILYQTPDEDVGFWYKNLKASRTELNDINQKTSLLERTNVLMKLRGTLNGGTMAAPQGISIFPNNRLFAIWGISSGILTVVFWLLWVTYIPPQKNEHHLRHS